MCACGGSTPRLVRTARAGNQAGKRVITNRPQTIRQQGQAQRRVLQAGIDKYRN